jgi:hypothetical protein
MQRINKFWGADAIAINADVQLKIGDRRNSSWSKDSVDATAVKTQSIQAGLQLCNVIAANVGGAKKQQTLT